MKHFDVVVVGELNADLILQDLQGFPEMGKEKLARGMTLTMGSASAILASNIARLGLRVGFLGKLGDDDLGRVVLDGLKSRRVDCSGIAVDPKVKTGLTVVMSFPHDYAMLTHMGAMESFALSDVNFDYVKRAKHLHLSSVYLQPGLRPGCAKLFEKAKEMGLSTSMDPGWDPSEEWGKDVYEILKHTDVFLPNEREAVAIAGASSVEGALDALGDVVPFVVVTLGSQGAVCRSRGKILRMGVFGVEPVDTTGAGDSFNAGFLHQWLSGGDVRKCMLWGSACGAIATTKPGGSTASPTLAELEEFLRSHPEPAAIDNPLVPPPFQRTTPLRDGPP